MGPPSRQQVTRRPRIIVAATGCIAAVKFGHLCESLKEWADVLAVVTKRAKQFIAHDTLPRSLTMYSDASELAFWKRLGDPVLHVELQKWADILVIAPLSANTLAKIAAGICDNLLTSIVKIWDCQKKPLLIAPAMSKPMWMNSTTEKHLDFLEDKGAVHIRHKSSEDSDPGPMAEISYICNTVHHTWDNLIHQPDKPDEAGEAGESGESSEAGEAGEPVELSEHGRS